MATLGSMIVNVLANTASFHKAINGVRGTLGSLQDVVGTVTGGLGSLEAGLGAIGVGFSAHAIVGELRSVADEMDNLAKVADRLGVSTEVFKGLEFGAGLAGVSSESLAGSLQTLNKQVAEAIHGGGKAKVVFDEMGISAEKLSRMSSDMQLRVLADGLGKIESNAERTRAALRLFGGDGAAMLNFLAEGEGAISSYMREAERLGLTYSREEVAKVEAFNDAWDTLQKTVGGFAKDFVIDIAPAALDAVKALQETIVGARALQATKVKTGEDKVEQEFTDWANSAIGYKQFDWAKNLMLSATDGITNWRIRRAVGAENSINNAFTPAELGANFNRYMGRESDAETAARGLRAGFGYLFGNVKSDAAMGLGAAANGLRQFNTAVDKAKRFGSDWQANWLRGELFGHKGDAAIDDIFSKRDTEAQVRGLKFLSDKLGLTKGFNDFRKMFAESGAAGQGGRFGVNAPIVRGTAEAYRLEHGRERIQQQALGEHRKANTILTKIEQALRVTTTGL